MESTESSFLPRAHSVQYQALNPGLIAQKAVPFLCPTLSVNLDGLVSLQSRNPFSHPAPDMKQVPGDSFKIYGWVDGGMNE